MSWESKCFLLRTISLHFFNRRKTIVCKSICNHLMKMLLVEFNTFRLNIWPIWSTYSISLIRSTTKKFEKSKKIITCSFDKSSTVCIFDSENKSSIILLCEQIRIKCCSNRTNMKWACWARRKTSNNHRKQNHK